MKRILFVLFLPIALIQNGCYVYSAFQSARSLKQGEFSITPSASSLTFHNDGESSEMTNNFGVQLGIGLPGNFNLAGRFELLRFDDDMDEGYQYLDFGLKYSLVPDILAFALPIGLFFGEDIDEDEAWQIHPSFFLTIPAHKHLDLNLSSKILVFFEDGADDLLALNAGLGINLNQRKISLMPEVGFLFNPGEDGNFFHYGLGISFKI